MTRLLHLLPLMLLQLLRHSHSNDETAATAPLPLGLHKGNREKGEKHANHRHHDRASKLVAPDAATATTATAAAVETAAATTATAAIVAPTPIYNGLTTSSNNSYSESASSKQTSSLVVATITTTPWRMNQTSDIKLTINSLLAVKKIDRLYVNIPWAYGVRTKSGGNVTVPEVFLNYNKETRGRLRVLRCDDYGPATKLLPLLLLDDGELPPDAAIITFDDDRIYTPGAVDALLAEAEAHPTDVIAIAAWAVGIFSSHGRRGERGGPNFSSRIPRNQEGEQYRKAGLVDIINGFFGVLYRKRFFYATSSTAIETEVYNYSAHAGFMQHCALVDDVWFSGHLERLKIARRVVGKYPDIRANPTGLSDAGALSKERGESVKQNHDNVRCTAAMREKYGIFNI